MRDKAMFELFYSSGLRLSELTGLALGDVDLSDATVRVTGKGNKTRSRAGRQPRAARARGLALRARCVARPGATALFVGAQRRRGQPAHRAARA